nr:putative germin-like protein 2-1 [Ipomoea batatas]
MATGFLVTLSIVAFTCSVAYAYDPSPLQDFCVAVNDPTMLPYCIGKLCEEPLPVPEERIHEAALFIRLPKLPILVCYLMLEEIQYFFHYHGYVGKAFSLLGLKKFGALLLGLLDEVEAIRELASLV